MSLLKREEIAGVSFVSAAFRATLQEFTERIDQGDKIRVITANPEMVMLAKNRPEIKEIVSSVDYVTPDGVGILLAGKILGRRIPERITGYDLTVELLKVADKKGWRVYLLGASPEVMEVCQNKLNQQYPNVELRSHHGFFKPEEEQEIIEQIQAHRPHILLVALGMPKQEEWLQAHGSQLPYNLAMGVGGTFDVLSGKMKRAPLLWQRLGVEWLYRLLKEPWRWKRMLSLPKFVVYILFNRN